MNREGAKSAKKKESLIARLTPMGRPQGTRLEIHLFFLRVLRAFAVIRSFGPAARDSIQIHQFLNRIYADDRCAIAFATNSR
jgi:hypothetical protein